MFIINDLLHEKKIVKNIHAEGINLSKHENNAIKECIFVRTVETYN